MFQSPEKKKGRAPKIFVAKLGQDGHDRGAKVVASSFADLGFKVELSKLFLTPEELFSQVKNSNADVVGISSHAAIGDNNGDVWLFGGIGSSTIAIISDGEINIEKLDDPMWK